MLIHKHMENRLIVIKNAASHLGRKKIKIGLRNYSGTPLVRSSLLHQKSGLSRGVASHQG